MVFFESLFLMMLENSSAWELIASLKQPACGKTKNPPMELPVTVVLKTSH